MTLYEIVSTKPSLMAHFTPHVSFYHNRVMFHPILVFEVISSALPKHGVRDLGCDELIREGVYRC